MDPNQNQPNQPVPTPVEPVAPVPASAPMQQPAPMPFSPPVGAPMVPAAPQKSKKGLIIGLVSGFVGLLLVAGIGVAVWMMNYYVSKDDYQKAADSFNKIVDLDSSVGSLSTTTSSSPETLDSKFNELSTQVKGMGDLRAIQKDDKLNKLYKTFKDETDRVVVFGHAVAEFIRAADDCKNVETKEDVPACVTKLRAVKDKGSQTVTDYAEALSKYLEDAMNGKLNSSAYYDATTKFTNDGKSLKNGYTDSGNALKDAINAKLK